MEWWHAILELADVWNSLPEIQDYFNHIIEKHETLTHNPPIRKYVNQKENRITFRIKTEHYLELLTAKETKLLGGSESKTTKYENWENLRHLGTSELQSWAKYLEENREIQ